MRRQKMRKRHSRKTFKKGTRIHKRNNSNPRRGGIRL